MKTHIERFVFWEQYQKIPVYISKQESDPTAPDLLKYLPELPADQQSLSKYRGRVLSALYVSQ